MSYAVSLASDHSVLSTVCSTNIFSPAGSNLFCIQLTTLWRREIRKNVDMFMVNYICREILSFCLANQLNLAAGLKKY